MKGIELFWESFSPVFEFAPGVEAEVADTFAPYAAAYMAFLEAKPFGSARVHQKADSTGAIKTEKVEAFSDKQYLYVCRTIGTKTRVFKFYATTGLLLTEAVQIAQSHYEMSTLELIDLSQVD
ncbi:hypothetical protein LZ023_40605 (plasmid) [Pseudomonas silvicola]|nr:hypothetical protein LZ023_40880 [Pseudomonas silvicola]WAH62236.1 hypothetical protein LZ023_40605 [Pseudomonas silvicola]